ncbi:hypothetical protein [Streptomyces sp. NPDC059918]|uniref:hypothetical protein n=1 Tax=unclassified Streptomyces TaxID=2593676 RepID=UPI0036591E58
MHMWIVGHAAQYVRPRQEKQQDTGGESSLGQAVLVPSAVRLHLYAEIGEVMHASNVRKILSNPGHTPLKTLSAGAKAPNLDFSPITDWEMLGDMTAARGFEPEGHRGTLVFVGGSSLPGPTRLCTAEAAAPCDAVHTCSGILGAFAQALGATDVHLLTCLVDPAVADHRTTKSAGGDPTGDSAAAHTAMKRWVKDFLAYAWTEPDGAERQFTSLSQKEQAVLLGFEEMDGWWNGRKAIHDRLAMGADFFPYFCGLAEREQLMMLAGAFWEVRGSAIDCFERDSRYGFYARASRLSPRVREWVLHPPEDMGTTADRPGEDVLAAEYEQAGVLLFQWPHMTREEQVELLDDEESSLREMFGVTSDQVEFVTELTERL